MQNQRKPVLYAGLLIVALVAGYLIYDNFIKPTPEGEIGIQTGNMLLDETIPNIDGSGSVKFSDYQGKILVIDFMAPWCEPCKAQIDILALVDSVEGVEVISINIDPNYDMEYLYGFGEEEGITWFFGSSPDSAVDFEVSAIPTIIIVDQDGLIAYRGYFTTVTQFDNILTELMN
ncbi:MAG: TlpA family protein disulfide reductase [Candidatus Bathyarchaeota archaeon]|nr:TlpA family protein disulfide reductase [Candidatus Bathyarchaeota archaeon]